MKGILVVGASRGVGFELVKNLLKSGEKVVALSRNMQSLNKLREKYPDRLYNISFDLSEFEKFELVLSELDRIDFIPSTVYYNAAYLKNKNFLEQDKEDVYHTFRINYFSYFFLTQFLMKKYTNPIHFVAISSMGGVQGSMKFGGLSAYSASKAALNNMIESLAAEFSSTKYRFNALALGAVNTEMLQEAFPNYKAPIDALGIADFIAWFGLNGHRYFNGKILPVSSSTP
ncbi:MAG: SDR family oxidoreductase [Bacteroidales bacterium]|nr:SDR family oxidoreductase [Bacteroidales bacterium]